MGPREIEIGLDSVRDKVIVQIGLQGNEFKVH